MKPFVLLISSFLISCLGSKLLLDDYHLLFCGNLALSLMLCFTALGHFLFSKGMQMMLPEVLPFKAEIVMLSGILEILLALALLHPLSRTPAGYVLILFFLLILPANIKAARQHINIEKADFSGPGLSYLWFRIPFQLLLIAWTFYFCISLP